jgi:hypothetical protein
VGETVAYDVRADTDVLYYGPRAHTRRWQRQRYLLWPAYAYRVVAPKVRERQINAFQKAVLALCQAGEVNPHKIGDLLDIHTDLVTLILEELRRDGLADHTYMITPHGERMLAYERGETLDEQSVAVGYVFQDPWSGRLWPRFIEGLEYADTEFRQGSRFPRLILGTKGKPRYRQPWVKLTDQSARPTTPTAADILHATRRHRRAIRGKRTWEGGGGNGGEDENEHEMAVLPLDAPQLERISIITPDPQPFLLATYLYLPEDELGIQDWHVCDPFGLGASPFLRREIVRHMETDNKLEEMVKRFLVLALGDDRNLTQHEQDIQVRQELAAERVKERLAAAIEFTPLFEPLVAMERAYQEAQDKNCPPDKLDDVLVKAGKALERLLADIWQKHPPSDKWRIFVTADRDYREELLNALAGQLGFTKPIPRSISRVKPGGVRRAAENGGGTLGQRVVVALLTARADNDHPLRKAAAKAPDLLERLGDVIKLRNQSAHDTTGTLTQQDVSRQVGIAYEVVRILAQI